MSSLLIVVLMCGFSGVSAAATEEVAEASNVSEFARVTGFHRVNHKASGFDVRLLEADGSATVAWDPVSLFLVVTNNGTSENTQPPGTQRIWRLPRGVERVRGISPTTCGVDVRVDVDRIKDTVVAGRDPKVLHLCFLADNRTLRPKLSVTEVSAGAKRKPG